MLIHQLSPLIMKRNLLLLKRCLSVVGLIYMLLLTSACDDVCEIGSPCDAVCEPGTIPICVTKSICSCVASGSGGTEGGMSIAGTEGGVTGGEEGGTTPPPVCEPLIQGDLVINEVMINPSESEPDHEYVELVNISAKELDLTGVNLTYNGEEKFRFYQGCMAPNSSVVTYSGGTGAGVLPWIWSTMPRGIGVYNYRYQFVNSRDFDFSLFSEAGQLLSQFVGESGMIEDGESITRSPELIGQPIEHSLASSVGALHSPAACANGGSFEQGCVDGQQGAGVEVTGGEMTGGEMMGGDNLAGEIAGGEMMMPPPACAAPLVGDLLINEVLIDADDESRGEFIEVLNQSDLSVNLDRIELLYQAPSGSLETKITFEPGCMAPHSAMVIYNNTREQSWFWSTPTADSQALGSGHSTFGLANSRDAVLELRAGSGQRLSQLTVPRSDITEEVSINRSPDAVESSMIVLHDSISGISSSPGSRPDGARYEDR